jgi:hypothetical protein
VTLDRKAHDDSREVSMSECWKRLDQQSLGFKYLAQLQISATMDMIYERMRRYAYCRAGNRQ